MNKEFKTELIKLILLIALIVGVVVIHYKVYVYNACELLGIEPTIKNMLTVNLFTGR